MRWDEMRWDEMRWDEMRWRSRWKSNLTLRVKPFVLLHVPVYVIWSNREDWASMEWQENAVDRSLIVFVDDVKLVALYPFPICCHICNKKPSCRPMMKLCIDFSLLTSTVDEQIMPGLSWMARIALIFVHAVNVCHTLCIQFWQCSMM